jgi:DNA-directed RNA polymerase specialized sigma24 family protein
MAIIDDICQYYKQQGSIQGTAQLAGISDQKARKLLITAGVIQPEKSRQALLYLSRGLKREEVAQRLGISVTTLSTYLPYTRPIYNQPTRSKNAERLSAWRKKRR